MATAALAEPSELESERTPTIALKEATARYVLITNALECGDDRTALYNIPAAKAVVRDSLDQLSLLREIEPALHPVMVKLGLIDLAIQDSSQYEEDSPKHLVDVLPELQTIEAEMLYLRLNNSARPRTLSADKLDSTFRWILQAVQWATNDVAKGDVSALETECNLIRDSLQELSQNKSDLSNSENDFQKLLSGLKACERDVYAKRIRVNYAEVKRRLMADDYVMARIPLVKTAEDVIRINDDGSYDGFLEGLEEIANEIDSVEQEFIDAFFGTEEQRE